jgi:hypothetical protein
MGVSSGAMLLVMFFSIGGLILQASMTVIAVRIMFKSLSVKNNYFGIYVGMTVLTVVFALVWWPLGLLFANAAALTLLLAAKMTKSQTTQTEAKAEG